MFPHEESIRRIEQCDFALIPLESEKEGQKPIHIPGKIYEFLKLEKRMLLLAEESDCREIAEKSGLAVFARPKDSENIADILKGLIENPSKPSCQQRIHRAI